MLRGVLGFEVALGGFFRYKARRRAGNDGPGDGWVLGNKQGIYLFFLAGLTSAGGADRDPTPGLISRVVLIRGKLWFGLDLLRVATFRRFNIQCFNISERALFLSSIKSANCESSQLVQVFGPWG